MSSPDAPPPTLLVSDRAHGDASGFGFEAIGDTLRDFIAAAPAGEPFNVCISGSWGSGKTTLLRRLADTLDSSRKSAGLVNVVLWFEPWKLTDEREVRDALTLLVLRAMSADASALKQLRVNLDGGNAIRLVGERLLGAKLDDVSHMDRAEGALRDSFVATQDLFDSIARTYLKKRRMVVFVDDLDRCSPDVMVAVLEAVKLFFDLPGLVFVFGLDRGQLEHALSERHRFTLAQARVYLEKIFQLTVALPPKGSGPLVAFLKDQLALVGADEIDDDLARAIVERFGRNLRDVKLFVNALSFQRRLDGTGTAGEDALMKWHYLETTIFRALPTTHADDQVSLVRALELLAHGGFLHDLPERDRYIRALRGGPVNHCALVVLALVRARRAELLPSVALKAAEQTVLDALEADGDVTAALRVMRAGRGPMADAALPAMASLTHAPMPPRERAGENAATPEEANRVTLEAGGLLSADEWDEVGRQLADGGDPVGAHLCHLMAHLMAPQSAVYLAHIARVLRHEGRATGSQALLRHAHELDRDSVVVHTQTAYLCDRLLDDKRLAAHLYRRVLELGTSISTVSSYLAAILAEQGDFADAFLCGLDAYLRSPSSGGERRLLRYAKDAGIAPDSVRSIEDLQLHLGYDLAMVRGRARADGKFPPPPEVGAQRMISWSYPRFPTLEQAADDLSDPLVLRAEPAR
ncbi:MAG: AAA family ATPase [Actinobacteria bacterium]|nr:AAA family ATPase [Actinomycetota bacterium]